MDKDKKLFFISILLTLFIAIIGYSIQYIFSDPISHLYPPRIHYYSD